MTTKSRILITGGTGFVGSATAKTCQRNGQEVAVLALPDDTRGDGLGLQGIQVIRGDLQSPPWSQIEAFGPTCCLHTAWDTTPGKYMTSSLNASFLDWSKRIIEGLFSRGVKYVLGIGSCAELCDYNKTPAPPYVEAKRALHQFLREKAKSRNDISAAWARIYYPFGPGEPVEKLVSFLIRKIRSGETVTIRTPDVVKDYIYISDVSDALERLLRLQPEGDFELGHGRGVSVRQLAEMIARLLDVDASDCLRFGNEPDSCPAPLAGNNSLRSLEWTPRISLEEGIRKTIKALSHG